MKYTVLLFIFFFALACNSPAPAPTTSPGTAALQSRVDSLEKKVTDTYRPGLGEFMLNIQEHHGKLWFAGTDANWKLANFEMGEIQETLDNIKKYASDRPEIANLPMLTPAINSVQKAIRDQSVAEFKSAYVQMTNTCTSCHAVSKYPFNVIKVPDTPPVPDQDFKPQQ